MQVMILAILHLIACIALVGVSLLSRADVCDRDRRMFPFICITGVLGLVMVHGVLIEWFVAYYSGAMYEVEEVTLAIKIRIGVSALILMLPWLGLIPYVARSRSTMSVIGGLASLVSMIGIMSMG